MMNHTPIQTPRKENQKKLPMIVDIAIGSDGEQVYHVHESAQTVRKEMPRFTNFGSGNMQTPVRNCQFMISPSSLDTRKVKEEINDEVGGYIDTDASKNGMRTAPNLTYPSDSASQRESKISGNDIWSQDIENAFLEILAIIPKKGSNKIKVSGRSCGRNELISDYIYSKTGVFRSRKQVSSHIQVIKNLGQNQDVIKLINDGPSFENAEKEELNNKLFESIFSDIALKKSLGINERKRSNSAIDQSHDIPRKRQVNLQGMRVENFFMLVNDNVGSNPIILTYQTNNEIKNLELREDAKFATRFPGLEEFQDGNIPIYHNMVKLQLPVLSHQYSMEGLQTSHYLKDDSNAAEEYSVYTSVYSFGIEVLKVNEKVSSNHSAPFLPKFWLYFFKKLLLRKDLSERQMAMKGITIKQIFYRSSGDSNQILKSSISSVLLWEFALVNSFKDTASVATKLSFPRKNIPPPLSIPSTGFSEEEAHSAYNNEFPNYMQTPSSDVQQKFLALQKKQEFYQSQYQQLSMGNVSQAIHPSVNANLMNVPKSPQDCQFGGYLFPGSDTEFMNLL